MNHKSAFRKLAGLAGIATTSLLISSPILAQLYPGFSFWQRPAYIYQTDDELPTIADYLDDNQSDQFNTLAADLDKAGLTNMLRQEGSFTIFAPTDEAFNALSYTQSQRMADPQYRKRVLEYHLVAGLIKPEDIPGEMKTLEGKSVTVTIGKNNPYEFWVNEHAQISPPESGSNGQPTTSLMFGRNGIIVPIDKVLIPPEL